MIAAQSCVCGFAQGARHQPKINGLRRAGIGEEPVDPCQVDHPAFPSTSRVSRHPLRHRFQCIHNAVGNL
eukprot:1847288-Alexandrium_andersonii.AAC.1